VGALLQENARLKREARIAEAERDSAVDSLERMTQKYNDLKRMRNIKRVSTRGARQGPGRQNSRWLNRANARGFVWW
jgi:hypothetical protein